VSKLTRPLELNREPSDLGTFIAQVINDQKARAEARNVRIDAEIADDSPPASIDVQQLRAALSSITARAVDSSPDGGVINIKLQSAPGEMRIEIADQNETLSEPQRQALFDFLAADRLNSTSLDLAYARRIVEQHGGQVKVYAGATVGTVVQVILKG
jgi:signal transduction histidine kinase